MVLLVRSVLFLIWFVVVSVAMHIVALPLLFGPRRFIVWAMKAWAWLTLFGLKWIAGLSYVLRGKEHIPPGAALVAAKHYTMWETIAVLLLLRDPAVVLKRELLQIPLYGWYARRAGMIAVDRAGAARAIRAMTTSAKRAVADGRQIVIFPEGTRRKVGDPPDYKPGAAALYLALGVPCVPLAHTSGLFWQAFEKRSGTIVVEFMPAIPAGLTREAFTESLEGAIETSVRRLLTENVSGT
jgi:1-acyl-sn-glycerol-3-phosphate acyltransferase